MAIEVFSLVTANPRDLLNGYVFQNREHAEQWMSQAFVTGSYRVDLWEASRPRRCSCGATNPLRLHRRIATDVVRPTRQKEEGNV